MPTEPTGESIELRSVLGAILASVQEAKRLGDLETARLLEEYRNNRSLSSLSIPAFGFSEIELELRFAVTATSGDKKTGVPSLRVTIDAPSLKALDTAQLQILKLKIAPGPIRFVDQQEEDKSTSDLITRG